MAVFIYHQDSGHGWLAVPMAELAPLGLTPGHFSDCSYRRAGVLYLEEDVDAGTFISAYRAQHGVMPPLQEVWDGSDSPIRGFARNRPGKAYERIRAARFGRREASA